MWESAPFKNIILSILFVVAAINFVRTTLDILKSSHRLDDAKEEISLLQQQKAALGRNIEYKKTSAYVEEKARNELNMAKDGETVYVVVGMNSDNSLLKKGQNAAVLGTSKVTVSRTYEWKSNLSQWWRLFF